MRASMKDSNAFIGLFYVILGEVYADVIDIESVTPDSNNELQPIENHDEFIQKLKHEPNYAELQDTYGYDLQNAQFNTFPRGRVYYRISDRKFVIVTCNTIASNQALLSKVMHEFGLSKGMCIIDTDYEYESYEDGWL
jgi:hypothetical protein